MATDLPALVARYAAAKADLDVAVQTMFPVGSWCRRIVRGGGEIRCQVVGHCVDAGFVMVSPGYAHEDRSAVPAPLLIPERD